MTTDFRALLDELLAWAERTSAHYVAPPDVIVRVRAALSAPEQGPTDEELYDLANDCDLDRFEGERSSPDGVVVKEGCWEAWDHQLVAFARAVLARWGRPAVEPVAEGPTYEELVELTDSYGVSVDDIGPLVSTVLTRWSRPAVEPVPVARRLPEPEDRDAKGRCWWLSQPARYAPTWVLQRPRGSLLSPFIAWAPHWALPLPPEGEP